MIRGYKRQIFVLTRTTVPFKQGYAVLLRFVVAHQPVGLILEQLLINLPIELLVEQLEWCLVRDFSRCAVVLIDDLTVGLGGPLVDGAQIALDDT